jgi:hypothetical protein
MEPENLLEMCYCKYPLELDSSVVKRSPKSKQTLSGRNNCCCVVKHGLNRPQLFPCSFFPSRLGIPRWEWRLPTMAGDVVILPACHQPGDGPDNGDFQKRSGAGMI